ncbi:Lysyl-tRNA synthetase [Elusimicrobium minutum Pei191]|uniref:Lysine--tRNA ligase n=1 Tax=Elusimicrobium minutum (strain Pei191) TaxID=445932 RepID=B2KAS9_ELUMP|nr:lysine--tRNA ligase [Elusimicrobium minutum]ACC97625.1 Lysyl-tRNA synthetase [Elusimicrobium minutum Pei191]
MTENNEQKLQNSLQEIISQRYKEAQELKEVGINPYPARSGAENRAKEALDADIDTQVTVSGRVVQLRLMGKAAFAHIRDFTGKVQFYAQKDTLGEENYNFFKKHISVGDFVTVKGHMFLTKTGEKTIKADSITLISKAIRPMPEKWHGVQDTEIRFRNRHVDLIANEDIKEIFVKRSKIISSIRKTLDGLGYLEVETPTLTPDAGGAIARPFETFHNALKMPLYMRIALELYHKRLIVGGLDRIYEIGKMFRNEGIDTTHNPEFTMMELYQAYGDVNTMADVFEAVLANAAEAIGAEKVTFKGKEVNLKPPYERVSMPEAWQKYVGEDIHNILDGRDFKRAELIALAKRLGLKVDEEESSGKIFDMIFDERIIVNYTNPMLMMDYPTAVSPFSKTKEGDSAIVERFEAFVCGSELGNAYTEINDPADQAQRLKDQAAQKAKDNEDNSEIVDTAYIEALESGMPPTGGMGIGIDRMIMLLTGQDSIREIVFFPLLKKLD